MVSVSSAVLSPALRSGSAPAVSAPTRLRIPDLLHLTDYGANGVIGGDYDHLLPDPGLPQAERWFTRIDGDDEVDIWLISWVPGQSTELHDHGGSLGALTVVSGALRETRWDGKQLRRRRFDAGDQAGFPLGWVHDVVWAPEITSCAGSPVPIAPVPPAPVTPTLSVHAYSPPLTAMSFYEVNERQTLRRKRTDLTEHPEG